jgi:hypothetical protein
MIRYVGDELGDLLWDGVGRRGSGPTSSGAAPQTLAVPKSKQEAINRSHMRALAHFLVLVALYATISTAYLVGTGGRFADWNPLRLIAVIGLPMLSFHSIRAAVRIYRSPRGHPPAES